MKRPLWNKNDNIGTISYNFNSCIQLSQCECDVVKFSFLGSLRPITVKNDPNSDPKIKKIIKYNVSIIILLIIEFVRKLRTLVE